MRRSGQHLTPSKVGVAILTTVLGCTGCGSAGGGGASASILDDLVAQARAQEFEEQARVLETGEVTGDDLLAATLRARECVAELGLEVGPITKDYFGSLNYEFDVGSGADADSQLAAADACQERHSTLVQIGHSRLNPPPADLAVAEVARCVEQRGGEVALDITSFDELLAAYGLESPDASSPLASCFREVTSPVVVVVAS